MKVFRSSFLPARSLKSLVLLGFCLSLLGGLSALAEGPSQSPEAGDAKEIRDLHNRQTRESQDLLNAHSAAHNATVRELSPESSEKKSKAAPVPELPIFRADELNQKLRDLSKKQDEDVRALKERHQLEDQELRKRVQSGAAKNEMKIETGSNSGAKISTSKSSPSGSSHGSAVRAGDRFHGGPVLDGAQVPKDLDFSTKPEAPPPAEGQK